MSTFVYSIVDAFATTPFKGNGAAVIILDPKLSLADATLQSIASEFNLSETAFVTPIDVTKGRFGLRWFTPTIEVPLCGHATLASASVLFSAGSVLPNTVGVIEFETVHSGVLTARSLTDGRIELEFPAGDATTIQADLTEKVGRVVSHAFRDAGNIHVKFSGVGDGASFEKYMLIEVEGIELEKAPVDPTPFLEVAPQYIIIIMTQRGRTQSETFVSRVFCPAAGIPEDPVTGSAHCMLGPYWAKKLQVQGTTEMVGKQVSKRSGEVGVVCDREKGTCKLRGHATLVAKGEFYLPK